MANDNFGSLEAEIAIMQKSEERLEYITAVRQIIDAYNTARSFISNLPPNIRTDNEESHIIGQMYFEADGFELGDLSITIRENEYLNVRKGTEDIFIFSKEQLFGDKDFILTLAKQIKDLVSKFQIEIKARIQEKKQKLIQEIKNF